MISLTMNLVAFLAAAPLLVVAMPATRQETDSTDLFNVLAYTRVVAGFNLNPFGAADERFWLPDTPASSTSCPSSVDDCPNVNLTIIASPSTLDSEIGGQLIYIDPIGALRFLPAYSTPSDAPPGSEFDTFTYVTNPNSPLLGSWLFSDSGGERGFAACQNTSANAFALWQVYVTVAGFAPTLEQDCISFSTFAQVYTGVSPTAYEYV